MKAFVGVAAGLAVGCTVAWSDLISNPVADGTITVDASRTDWAGLTSYPTDAQDAGAGDVDFQTFTLAHDSDEVLIRYTTYDGPGFGSAWRYNIFIDIDQNRSTGYIGGGSQFSVGADILIQGATAFSFAGGDQTTFSWNFIGGGSFNELANDLEISVARANLTGLDQQFNWIAFGDNGAPDYVPDGGSGGSGGSFHTYVVPEPGTVLLLAGGLTMVGLARRRVRIA